MEDSSIALESEISDLDLDDNGMHSDSPQLTFEREPNGGTFS
jgi:hypothetical protein